MASSFQVFTRQITGALFSIFLLSGCSQTAPPEPYGAIPTENQQHWQQNNVYAFIHFGINTFTDKEWGYGDEDPSLFNPSHFDAEQIVRTIAHGGFKGVILTCKHHDGFCLWPTKTTTHNITKSPFRDGKGDLVKEIADACRKYGLKFGVYLSPWDRNAPSYGTPAYVDMYRAQMKELLTQYGDIFEIWHDGANGGDGYYGGARERRNIDRSTYYNWPSVWKLERKLQPKALIFGDIGPDLRWVGNEKGFAGDPCWQTFTPESIEPGKAPSNGTIKSELSTEGTRDGKYWMPAEVDFSIRPGWFWHESENGKVRTALNLWDHYFLSAGRGASMLLNIPPDKEGLIYKTDSMALENFGKIKKETFAKNLIKGAKAQASNVRGGDDNEYGTQYLFDQDQFSYWGTDDEVHTPTLTITLPEPRTFDIIRLKENTKLGQRIDSLEIDGWLNGDWEKITGASSIGSNRLLRLDRSVTTQKLRIRVVKAPVSIALSDVGLFIQPERVRQRISKRASADTYNMFNTDNWKVIGASDDSKKMLDGDVATSWEVPEAAINNSDKNNGLVVDMGKIQAVSGFTYLPKQGNKSLGAIDKYALYLSLDGRDWQKVASGEFANIQSNPTRQAVSFKIAADARFFKLVPLHTVDGKAPVIAELGVFSAK